jgi:hypothetical protein
MPPTESHKWGFQPRFRRHAFGWRSQPSARGGPVPYIAVGAGLLAHHWLVEGYGYDITSADVRAACSSTMKAAGGFVSRVLGRELSP